MRESSPTYAEMILEPFSRFDLYGLAVAAFAMWYAVKVAVSYIPESEWTPVQAWGLVFVLVVIGFFCWRTVRYWFADEIEGGDSG